MAAAAACRRAPPVPARLSIVVITIDTLRADHVNARLTPTLAALARDGVAFDTAITVAPLTLPAHASLLTGLYPPRHRVRDNQVFRLPEDVATFPGRLKADGYATGAFVSAVVLDHRYGLGRGFDVYDDEIAGPERDGHETIARAERWLERTPRPFFLWVHLFEPHAPYRTGSYEGEIAGVDRELAAFFRFLRDRHLWDDTVLSVTSDHGESLGEHGERTHGFFLYDATLRIPWIVKAPGLSAAKVSDQVRIVDEMPTIVRLAGTGGPGALGLTAIDGSDLTSAIEQRSMPRLEAYSETFLPRDQFGWSPLMSVRTARFKYIEAPEPELYDLAADPGEATNVAASTSGEAARLKRLAAAMASAPAAAVSPVRQDPVMAEKLTSLGYIASSPGSENPASSSLADPKSKLTVYNLTMDALELSENGHVAAALAKLDEAERIDRNVAQVEFLKGALFGQRGDFARAAAALQRTVELNPRYVTARLKLALAYLRLGRADAAQRELETVLRDDPRNFRALHDLATIAYSQGQLDRAEELERQALAVESRYFEAWNTLGAIAIVRKDRTHAIEALSTATRLNPASGQAWHNLSLAYSGAGRDDEARRAAAAACSADRRYCRGASGSVR